MVGPWMRSGIGISVVIASTVAWIIPGRAEAPAAYCKRIGTDDTTRPIPESLVPAVNAAFAMQMPPREAIATTVYRCAGGRVTACTVGANLPCGKANVSRAPEEGIVRWCHENPNSDVVPAVASGHDTIYEWRCSGGVPLVARQVLHVDARGFVAEFWKTLR